MRKRSLLGGLVAAAAFISMADTASAIRWGQPDAGEHPHVGIMVGFFDDANGVPQPAFRCSGTLMSPTVFLTAGHCTFEVDHVEIWFQEDVTNQAMTGYPFEGQASGQAFTHPEYDDDAFFLHDVGVVVLDEPFYGTGGTFGELPEEGYLDQFFDRARGQNRQLFEVVGYGRQRSMPEPTGLTVADRIRMKADVRLINNDRTFGGGGAGNYVVFSNNANTGGTCFGDSGGPAFASTDPSNPEWNTVVAVTSFGVNSTCSGTGGSYRVDQPDDLEWLGTYGI